MRLELVNSIHIIIVWMSLLFFVVLLTPKFNQKKSNRFLALLLLTIGIHFSYNVMFSNQVLLEILPAYSCSYGFLYGPLLYFYVAFSLEKDRSLNWKEGIHFLPFFLVILFTSIGVYVCAWIQGWVLLIMLMYCIAAFYKTIQYKRMITIVSSKTENSEIQWIHRLIYVMFAIIILNVLQFQIQSFTVFKIEVPVELLVQIGILFMVSITIFQGLKNPTSFQQLSKDDLKIINRSLKKIDKLEVNEKQKALAESLTFVMEKNQPFLAPDLTLNTLAENLNTTSLLLSQTIKKVFKTNFSEYVNSYRVEYAKELLIKSIENQDTIKEIMYDSGFNSRSVFNTFFKKKYGVTPSEFKKNQALL